MDKQRIEIGFPDQTPDVAGRFAEDLGKEIGRSVKDDGKFTDPKIVRADATAMDFGSTIVLVLGTPAVTILAKAILEWAKRTNKATISLNGVRIDKLESRDVAAVIKALDQAANAKG